MYSFLMLLLLFLVLFPLAAVLFWFLLDFFEYVSFRRVFNVVYYELYNGLVDFDSALTIICNMLPSFLSQKSCVRYIDVLNSAYFYSLNKKVGGDSVD